MMSRPKPTNAARRAAEFDASRRPKISSAKARAIAEKCGGQQDDAGPKVLGRPPLPADQAQTATIRVRCTEAQLAEFEARGGKAWLMRELGRKPRK